MIRWGILLFFLSLGVFDSARYFHRYFVHYNQNNQEVFNQDVCEIAGAMNELGEIRHFHLSSSLGPFKDVSFLFLLKADPATWQKTGKIPRLSWRDSPNRGLEEAVICRPFEYPGFEIIRTLYNSKGIPFAMIRRMPPDFKDKD